MNTAYRDLILARVQAAVGGARAVKKITHKGLKGQLREIVIRDLFYPLLPSDVGVGYGVIISADNRQSRQQDVVIFDRRILPPILLERSHGIFPIESVLYAIEIKSKITAAKMKASHASAKELKEFKYQSGNIDEFGNVTEHVVKKVISCVLAFDTDLTLEGKNEVKRYDEIRGSEGSEIPEIPAICVVDRGYWYWSEGEWKTWKRSYEFEEVVGFIASLMNIYRMIASSRKEPWLGRYLTDN